MQLILTFLFLLSFLHSTYANPKTIPYTPGVTFSLYGTSRGQVSDKKNFLKNFKRNHRRSKHIAGGLSLGYQFLGGTKAVEGVRYILVKRRNTS